MNQPATNVNGQVSSTFVTALKRALLLGVVLGIAAFVKERPDTGPEAIDATYDALGVLFGVLIARGGLEGAYDARRQAEGNVSPSDVQPSAPAVVVENAQVAPPVVAAPDAPDAPHAAKADAMLAELQRGG